MRTRAAAVVALVVGCAAPAPLAEPVAPAPIVAPRPIVEPAARAEIGATEEAPPTAPAPEPKPPPPAQEAVERLRRRLVAAIARRKNAGTERSILIVDVASGAVLFEDGADRALIPASNAKLFTTAAAVARLGDDHRLSTRILASAAPVDGVVTGDLTLRSGEDFTWALRSPKDPAAIVDELVDRLADGGVRRVDGAARAEGTFHVEGARAGELDEDAQRAKAKARFVRALARRKIALGARAIGGRTTVELAAIASPPLVEAIVPINTRSHNAFAELLLRHLGAELANDPTAAGGARAVLGWASETGVAGEGLALVDGSGLSRSDRASARAIVALLVAMHRRGPSFEATLAIAGTSGTLQKRLLGDDTRARVIGKTGTLAEVAALSGLVHNRHDDRRVAFAIVQNGARDIAAARALEDELVTLVAARWSD